MGHSLTGGDIARLSHAVPAAQAILFDLDGTVYTGETACPGIVDFIDLLARLNIEVAFLSNNSTASAAGIARKLTAMGVRADADRILTPTSITGEFITDRYGPARRVFVVGTRALKDALVRAGHRIVSGPYKGCDVVVVGRDTGFSYEKLTQAARFVAGGAALVATNPDRSHPGDGGALVPETAALVAAIRTVCEVEPQIVGKPYPALFLAALHRLGAPPQRVLMVGDNPGTDLAGGRSVGMQTVWYSPFAVAPPPADSPPDFVLADYAWLVRSLQTAER